MNEEVIGGLNTSGTVVNSEVGTGCTTDGVGLDCIRGDKLLWNEQWIKLPSGLLEDYKLKSVIGEGTYGKVFLAGVKESNGSSLVEGKMVAVKILSIVKRSEGIPPTTMREMTLLKHLDNDNIVKLYKIYMGDDSIALVFEHCETDLGHILDMHIKDDLYLSRSYIRSVIYQILKGLQYIHREGILHRDIKPQNILLTKQYREIKLADFGLSRTFGLSPEHELMNCTAVTLWYRPPELLLGQSRYSTAADVWSVGCLFSEMLMTRTVLNGSTEMEQLRKIFSILKIPPNIERVFPETDRLSFLWDTISRRGPRLPSILHLIADKYSSDLLLKMLSIDPKTRITIDNALNHPFFTDKLAVQEIHSFLPLVSPSAISQGISQMVPKLPNSSGGESGILTEANPDVENLFISELARLARQTTVPSPSNTST